MAQEEGPCSFGAFDNLPEENAVFTARIEDRTELELPEGAVICGLEFDFEGIDGGQAQDMEYDDNFLFLFGDVVLASSYAPLMDLLPEDDVGLPTWDWASVVGSTLEFGDIPTWCLGEDDGDSTCNIPPPETPGTLEMDFGGDLVDRLSFHAHDSERYDFTFVATGDNDDTDCSHSAFEFGLGVPVVVTQ